MRSRFLLAITSLVGLACVLALVLSMLPPRPGVTRANYNRLQIGMTQAEVESIIWTGREEKDTRGNKVTYVHAEAGSIWVLFEDDKAVLMDYWLWAPKAPLIERIFRWLGLC